MAIAGYKLKVNGGSYTDRIIDAGDVLTYEIDALEHGVLYEVRVAAYDGSGYLSEWSDPEYLAPLASTMLIDSDGEAILDSDGNAIVIFS